ncbi:hypothetical protein [Thermococcus sp. JCM 11816]|uniref:hypothetical protein n=1 Tax=Thermococcus sp. (strain JCM 11816 / KS-1) TaxID=1295125 RepID=UPI003467C5B5
MTVLFLLCQRLLVRVEFVVVLLQFLVVAGEVVPRYFIRLLGCDWIVLDIGPPWTIVRCPSAHRIVLLLKMNPSVG